MAQGSTISTIYMYFRFTNNNSMLPASIFDILTRPSLTTHARRGSDNAFSKRLYGKHVAEEHTFFKPEQPFYTNSIDPHELILQEGL